MREKKVRGCISEKNMLEYKSLLLWRQRLITSVRNLPDRKTKTKGEKNMRNKKVLFIVQAAMIAAIYVVLTYFISAFNLASGAIQVRISEAAYHFTGLYTGSYPGTFYRMSAQQSVDGLYAA